VLFLRTNSRGASSHRRISTAEIADADAAVVLGVGIDALEVASGMRYADPATAAGRA
jgi:hypothetical protein